MRSILTSFGPTRYLTSPSPWPSIHVRQRIELHRRIGKAARQKHSDDRCAGKSLHEQLLRDFEVLAAIQYVVENHDLSPHARANDCLVNTRDRQKFLETLSFRGLVIRGCAA